MKCINGGLAFDIPPRLVVASLRSPSGERIGRVELIEADEGRAHRWEWLETRWPARPFLMRPDPHERASAPGLSACMPLPGRIRRPERAAYVGPDGGCQRLYDVHRVDGPKRQLAVLAVHGERLHWYELGTGGVLELVPGWLLFVPRSSPVDARTLTRCIVQERATAGSH